MRVQPSHQLCRRDASRHTERDARLVDVSQAGHRRLHHRLSRHCRSIHSAHQGKNFKRFWREMDALGYPWHSEGTAISRIVVLLIFHFH